MTPYTNTLCQRLFEGQAPLALFLDTWLSDPKNLDEKKRVTTLKKSEQDTPILRVSFLRRVNTYIIYTHVAAIKFNLYIKVR